MLEVLCQSAGEKNRGCLMMACVFTGYRFEQFFFLARRGRGEKPPRNSRFFALKVGMAHPGLIFDVQGAVKK